MLEFENEEVLDYKSLYEKLLSSAQNLIEVVRNLEDLTRLYSRDYRHIRDAVDSLERTVNNEDQWYDY